MRQLLATEEPRTAKTSKVEPAALLEKATALFDDLILALNEPHSRGVVANLVKRINPKLWLNFGE